MPSIRSLAAIVLGIVAMATLVQLFGHATQSITRLALGALLGLAISPLVARVRERLSLRHGLAVLVVALGLVAAISIGATFLGPPAVNQGRRFATELPETVRKLYELPVVGDDLKKADVEKTVTDWVDQRVNADTVKNATGQVLGGVAAVTTILFAAVGVLLDGPGLVRRFRRLFPPEMRDRADRVGRVFYEVIGTYFAGSVVVAVLAGVFALTLGLILQIPLAPLGALWVMLTDLIPQVGGFLGGALLVGLALSRSPMTGVVCLAAYIVYLNIENHIIQPAIVGRAVDLSPPTTMLAAIIGGAIAGVPGALFATPLVGTVKQLYLEFRGERGDGDDDASEPAESPGAGPAAAGTESGNAEERGDTDVGTEPDPTGHRLPDEH